MAEWIDVGYDNGLFLDHNGNQGALYYWPIGQNENWDTVLNPVFGNKHFASEYLISEIKILANVWSHVDVFEGARSWHSLQQDTNPCSLTELEQQLTPHTSSSGGTAIFHFIFDPPFNTANLSECNYAEGGENASGALRIRVDAKVGWPGGWGSGDEMSVQSVKALIVPPPASFWTGNINTLEMPI